MKIPLKNQPPQAPQTPSPMTEKSPPEKEGMEDHIFLDIKKENTPLFEEKTETQKSLLEWYRFIDDYLMGLSRISLSEKLAFFQLLSATHNAGIPLTEALGMIGEQTKHQRLKKIILNLKELVEDGNSLADAMKRNSDVFDQTIYTIVEAGEKSGKLHDVLNELVNQYERIDLIRKKVVGMFIYPVVVFVFMILAGLAFILFILPQLESLFQGGDLPFVTRMFLKAKDVIEQGWALLIVGFLGIVFGFSYWKKTRSGGKIWTQFVLKIPVVNEIYRGMILARFSRIFGFLISAGVPIIEVLRLGGKSTQNVLYEEKILLASDDLSRGISLAENISDNEDMFPNIFVKMISIGEKSAATSEIMEKIAVYYEEIVERMIKRLSTVMEPLFLLFIAGGVLLIILAIYSPIMGIYDVILERA